MHPRMHDVVEAHLAVVDAQVPELVEGLYLVRSVALDAWRRAAVR
jgi:hypothetical protein